ncbi:SPOR domain-containing protein, partial [Ameyamaea chiangmaiensis]
AASSAYGVQLAALASEASAQAEWARLTKAAPGLFAGRTPVVERVEHAGSVFFRLRTRGFTSIADATEFCAHAKAQGVACTLARF